MAASEGYYYISQRGKHGYTTVVISWLLLLLIHAATHYCHFCREAVVCLFFSLYIYHRLHWGHAARAYAPFGLVECRSIFITLFTPPYITVCHATLPRLSHYHTLVAYHHYYYSHAIGAAFIFIVIVIFHIRVSFSHIRYFITITPALLWAIRTFARQLRTYFLWWIYIWLSIHYILRWYYHIIRRRIDAMP